MAMAHLWTIRAAKRALGLRYTVALAPGPSSHALAKAVSCTSFAPVLIPHPVRAYKREYPDAPRVGVGVVVLREAPGTRRPEVLLVQRGKEPDKGHWSVPGGGLELGERVEDCAAREVLEETGLTIKTVSDKEPLKSPRDTYPPPGDAVSSGAGGLQLPIRPTPFTSVDCIVRDEDGQVVYHYMIVEVVGTPVNPEAKIIAKDDALDVRWIAVEELPLLHPLVKNTSFVCEEAVKRFSS
eukprot:CAMPEP_0114263990 /NCGR_PEP_ID=MMETSP0058-20121206/22900_1 /TAXON_ID=36894 /ORGANISM="Pyramimonas parkeae, CCMP726" /LENGTH=238 /DNA_ID=CAMNT_0001380499 /DNA_START=25 /DNA_END=741 /DNA_ORIENTATION=-